MSDDDSIFLATSKPVGEVAEWLAGTLGLERVDDPELTDGQHFFRGRARTVDGKLLVLVEPNHYGEVDPESDEVSAIDDYPVFVDIHYAGERDEELQQRAARAVFDELVKTNPDMPMILSHNLALFIAAYLPSAGVQYFEPGTTLDAPDSETWRPWVTTD
jgi:hypothetical protein